MVRKHDYSSNMEINVLQVGRTVSWLPDVKLHYQSMPTYFESSDFHASFSIDEVCFIFCVFCLVLVDIWCWLSRWNYKRVYSMSSNWSLLSCIKDVCHWFSWGRGGYDGHQFTRICSKWMNSKWICASWDQFSIVLLTVFIASLIDWNLQEFL